MITWQVKGILGYLLVVNGMGFVLMGVDKRRAKKELWRISERTLFLFVFAGGGLGAYLGMKCFRHKTKHWYFRYGIPAIIVGETLLIFWLFFLR